MARIQLPSPRAQRGLHERCWHIWQSFRTAPYPATHDAAEWETWICQRLAFDSKMAAMLSTLAVSLLGSGYTSQQVVRVLLDLSYRTRSRSRRLRRIDRSLPRFEFPQMEVALALSAAAGSDADPGQMPAVAPSH